MARIPLGTSGGRMPEVALRLESEKRQDIRQQRQIRAQQSQFFASLMQRQAESESRLALDENAQALDEMQSQLREEGLRKHRSFQEASANVKMGSEYGQQVAWNPATKQFDAKAVEAGQGFEIAKTKKAREKAEKLASQVQARQALATATAPGLAMFDPEFEAYRDSLVNSSVTDSQMVTRIQEYEKDKIRSLVDGTMRDPNASPEQKTAAMSALWESGQEAPHDTAINTLAKNEFEDQRKPGYGEMQAEKAIAIIDKDIRELEKNVAFPPWAADPVGKGDMGAFERARYIRMNKELIEKYKKQKAKAQAGIVEMAKKRMDAAKSYQQIYLELATDRAGEVEARVQEYMSSMQNTVSQIQQAGMAGQGPEGQAAPQAPLVDTEGQPSGPPSGQTLLGQPMEPMQEPSGGAPKEGDTVLPDRESLRLTMEKAGPEADKKLMDLNNQLEKANRIGDTQTKQRLVAEILAFLRSLQE